MLCYVISCHYATLHVCHRVGPCHYAMLFHTMSLCYATPCYYCMLCYMYVTILCHAMSLRYVACTCTCMLCVCVCVLFDLTHNYANRRYMYVKALPKFTLLWSPLGQQETGTQALPPEEGSLPSKGKACKLCYMYPRNSKTPVQVN